MGDDDSGGRPYRSHAQPACESCRRRKSRCKTTTDQAGTCLMCQVHGTECVFRQSEEPRRRKLVSNGRPRRSGPTADLDASFDANTPSIPGWVTETTAEGDVSASCTSLNRVTPANQARASQANMASDPSPVSFPQQDYHTLSNREDSTNVNAMLAESGDLSAHVISPAIADDNDELESYLSSNPNNGNRKFTRTLSTPAVRQSRPVLFSTVLRRPLGTTANQSLACSKLELIEKLLEPYVADVVDLFFDNTNVCFPILDEKSFRKMYTEHKEKLSPALLASLYANALTYWNKSPKLQAHHPPDHRYVWVQANEALNSELFLAPGVSSVISIILNVCGRPSTSMFGNGGMIGTAVALSNALGLNRDPSNWNISPSEKAFRIRIWWLIVILDRWSSLAYGTPLLVHRVQQDVPIPTKEILCPPDASQPQIAGTSIFLALLTLTEVLGYYLEHIYHVAKPPNIESSPMPVDFEAILTNWEDTLPDNAMRRLVMRGNNLEDPGAANIRLSYLSVKLLLSRISSDPSISLPNVNHSRLQAQRVAEEVVHLVEEVAPPQLSGFWLPTNAFALTSATTFLLRSALKPVASANRNTALELAKEMIGALKTHRKYHAWDLADDCLASCENVVARIEAGTVTTNAEAEGFQGSADIEGFVFDDVFMGLGAAAFEDGFWQDIG